MTSPHPKNPQTSLKKIKRSKEKALRKSILPTPQLLLPSSLSASSSSTYYRVFATFPSITAMFKSLALASLVGSAVAFSPARISAVRQSHKVSMSAEFLPGALAPLGYFDPLSLSAGKTEGEVRKIREAELKHGR